MVEDIREETREGFLVRVVDDDESMRRSWQFLIEGEGWSVKTYDTATAFLNEDDPTVPGCVILDVRMPEMSGIEMQMEMQVRDYFCLRSRRYRYGRSGFEGRCCRLPAEAREGRAAA